MTARKISVSLMILFISMPMLSFSSTPKTPVDSSLTPYSAVYSTVWKKGISVKVTGKQTLSKINETLWLFDFSAKNMLASMNETAVFYIEDQHIIPTKYHFKSSVLGKKRTATLTFDWDKNLVRNDVKDKPWNLSINPTTLDKLSVQLQVRLDLQQGKDTFDYQIADGGHIKNWQFKREEVQTINTKLGRLSTVKVIRTDNLEKGKKTSFWFAPEFDYLLVKLEHIEDGESYELDIESMKPS